MTPSEQIDKMIADLSDWRGDKLAELRALINEGAPDLKEAWKWDCPVWAGRGNVVALGAFKEHVKVNFFKGAALDDPDHVFNAGLDAKQTRSIDVREGESLNEKSFTALVRAAAAADSTK